MPSLVASTRQLLMGQPVRRVVKPARAQPEFATQRLSATVLRV